MFNVSVDRMNYFLLKDLIQTNKMDKTDFTEEQKTYYENKCDVIINILNKNIRNFPDKTDNNYQSFLDNKLQELEEKL